MQTVYFMPYNNNNNNIIIIKPDFASDSELLLNVH